uniref:Uncharacterized protein n=1 Tax=Anopheles merus TaxID=30066 RepID=A0A182VHT6_ANOME
MQLHHTTTTTTPTTATTHQCRHTRIWRPEPLARSGNPATSTVITARWWPTVDSFGLAQSIRHRPQPTARVWKRNAQFGGIYPPNYDLVHQCLRSLPFDKPNAKMQTLATIH